MRKNVSGTNTLAYSVSTFSAEEEKFDKIDIRMDVNLTEIVLMATNVSTRSQYLNPCYKT
jgi:hypothetical protein